jgi:hypothetical protein
MNNISFIRKYNFRMTDTGFGLDSEIFAARFCFANNIEPDRKVWLSGYCLFYISSNGLGLYQFIGRGVNPSGESLGIDVGIEDNYKLKITGVDEI